MIWWLGWGLVALAWAGHLLFSTVDWQSVVLGGFTGLMLASWAVEMSGNKMPSASGEKPTLGSGNGGMPPDHVQKLPNFRRD